MDLVLHGLTGVIIVGIPMYLFGILAFNSLTLIILSIVWVMGAYPDLMGYFDGLIRGDRYRWNGWYRQSHDATKGIWKILGTYNIFGWFHITIDKFWHNDEKGGWKWWGISVDILIWYILIVIGILLL